MARSDPFRSILLSSLFFFDKNTGWTVGFYAPPMKTTDAGRPGKRPTKQPVLL
jgi:hypothetical protein